MRTTIISFRFRCELPVSLRPPYYIGKVEEALTNGQKLELWYRQQEPVLNFFPLDLEKSDRLQNRAEGFFSRWDFNGNDFSVMGCGQEVNLGFLRGPDAKARLQ